MRYIVVDKIPAFGESSFTLVGLYETREKARKGLRLSKKSWRKSPGYTSKIFKLISVR